MSVDVLASMPDALRQRIESPIAGDVAIPSAAAAAPVPADPLADRLPGECFSLNDQQQAIVAAVVGRETDTVVKALAGTGKTSTLEALARRLQISRPGERILYIAFNKALRDDQPVFTERGWRSIGRMQVGDRVFGLDGQLYPVQAVTHRGVRPMNEVEFSDGTTVIADDDHLWMTQWIVTNPHDREGSGAFKVRTTAEIARTIQRNHRVPHLSAPVDTPHRDLPLHPYLMGALLGDGGIKWNRVGFTCAEEDLLRMVDEVLPSGVRLNKERSKYGYNIVSNDSKRPQRGNPVLNALKMLGLQGKGSRGKFIPTDYLMGSIEQRLALLKGLMDTDGCANGVTAAFVTVSKGLVEGITFLAQSLGGMATTRVQDNGSFYVNVRLGGMLCPFALPRKIEAWRPRTRDNQLHRKIVAIRPVEPAHATCISIDAPEHLFLTKGFIPTHNSVQKEAEARMPANVESRTGHSLAWRQVGEDFWGKTPYGKKMLVDQDADLAAKAKYLRARPASVGKALGISPHAADLVISAVGDYANSADEDLEIAHVEAACAGDGFSRGQLQHLLRAAKQYWEDIATPLSAIGTRRFQPSQDHLRKLWALSGPDFTATGSGVRMPAQILCLDEAQDTPPVLSRVVDQQKNMQQIIVGDAQQAIYGFSGTMDYLAELRFDTELPLTTSYRFGPDIESVANRFLDALESEEKVVGHAPEDFVGRVDQPDAVLTRTNAGMLDEIVAEAAKDRRVGLLTTSRQDLDGLVQTTAYLRDGADKPRVWHPILSRYDSWIEVEYEAEQATASMELQVAMRIVKEWSLTRLEEIVAESVEVTDAARAACDVVVVTAHKAKGLEWDAVRIGGDFYGPHRPPPKISKTEYDNPEHLRLDYVAVTRAKKALELGSLGWIQSYRPGADVQVSALDPAPGSMSCDEVDDMLSLMRGKK